LIFLDSEVFAVTGEIDMNQPEQTNLAATIESTGASKFGEPAAETVADKYGANGAEWFPEDDDEWYEPDYCKTERAS
jgi:hypothetical protein